MEQYKLDIICDILKKPDSLDRVIPDDEVDLIIDDIRERVEQIEDDDRQIPFKY